MRDSSVIRLRVVLVLGCFLCVSSFSSIFTWESLFKSNPRKFSTEENLQQFHSTYFEKIKSSEYSHKYKQHAFIVELLSSCGSACHSELSRRARQQRYSVINSAYGQVIASVPEMMELAAISGDIFTKFTPMPPVLKIDKDLDDIALKCEGIPTAKPLTLHLSVAAMPTASLSIFLETFLGLSVDGSSIQSDVSGLHAESTGLATVSTRCNQLSGILKIVTELPEVLWVEQRLPVVAHNRWAKGICQSGAAFNTPLYSTNITGRDQIIGIADTGLDSRSAYFYDPYVAVPFDKTDFNHRKIVSYTTTYGDGTDPYLVNDIAKDGHGTHVCGSAAGLSYVNYGDYKDYNGAAFNSKIAFTDIEKTAGSLSPPSNLYTQLFKPMYVNAGARIFSNSWGTAAGGTSASNQYTSDARSVDAFMVDYPDALVIFSGGNNGDKGFNTVGSPSTNKNGICAGASLNDHDSFLAYAETGAVFSSDGVGNFSSKGPTADGRRKPDLLAPGWWVTSAQPSDGISIPSYAVHGLQGTSQSAPLIAGMAALAREYFTAGFYPNGKRSKKSGFIPSGALLKAVLLHSGQQLDKVVDAKGTVRRTLGYPSNVQGFGLVRLDTVLNFGRATRSPLNLFVVGAANASHPYYASLSPTKRSQKYIVTTGAATTVLRVTLAYTDAKSADGATRVLVNNLDVSIEETKTGKRYLPLPNNANSKVDNVEQIIITSPLANTNYTITVYANYTVGVQPFALVVTGDVIAYNASGSSNTNISKGDDTISSVNQGVIAVLSVACSVLLLVVVCVVVFNRKPKNVEENYTVQNSAT